MADPRETILARLLVICEGIDGIATAERNPASLDDLQLPALAIMDGDEVANEGDLAGGKPAGSSPQRVTMTPEIVIKMEGRPEVVGTSVNAVLAALKKAVLGDAALAAACTNGGGVRYIAAQSSLGYGRTMVGEMAVSFGLTYVLRPDRL